MSLFLDKLKVLIALNDFNSYPGLFGQTPIEEKGNESLFFLLKSTLYYSQVIHKLFGMFSNYTV